MDFYGFYTGKEMEAYRFLGAHLIDGGVVFRTFAPAARHIALIGDFSDWQEIPMMRIHDGNFWETTVWGAQPGQRYKFRIYSANGSCVDHCDPYGFSSELRPANASVIADLNRHQFNDNDWMWFRKDMQDQPLNIYEMHFGSWRKKGEEETDWYTYEELPDLLIPYLKDMGYNYVELMPLSEHPCDQSWGYQNTGFFAPTSRYGTPEGLQYFVDRCHQAGIGVIMDFVPVHFAVDGFALANYDGTCLYEYPNQAVGRSEWGSCNFMHSRGEVRSFLQSAACYWLQEYHFDGLRMDAISNLIYWQGNSGRGVNRDAVHFLQYMNGELKRRMPSAMLIAEDSSAYPGVTRPTWEGGLGFDFKWDLGWMNDTLSYFQAWPSQRPERYHKLTFSMMYFRNEKYLLPFSHDEVVHGKATILQKMYGQYEEKFPQARALYLYMMAHPGKKLNFMGNELGQLREWDEKREQDWLLLDYPIHDAFKRYQKELNHLYLDHPALYQGDYGDTDFEWVDCHQEQRCIYAFMRKCIAEKMLFIFNFSDREQVYELPEGRFDKVELCFHSDWERFGGTVKETVAENAQKETKKTSADKITKVDASADRDEASEDSTFKVTLPPYSGQAFYVSLR